MIGLALTLSLLGAIFAEVADSTGKKQIAAGRESLYLFGAATFFWSAAFFLVSGWLKNSLIFSWQSLPTFIPRLVLEIAVAHLGIVALVKADRTTFSFLRILTVPLLLIVDLVIGYSLSINQIIGIAIITLSLILVSKGLSQRGSGYVILGALGAVATISLYKYNIENFNSVEAEQGIVTLVLFIYFLLWAIYSGRKSFSFLRSKLFIGQSISLGLSAYVSSWAYFFAPASIVAASGRIFTVLTTLISGQMYFHERHFALKFLFFLSCAVGIILLAVG